MLYILSIIFNSLIYFKFCPELSFPSSVYIMLYINCNLKGKFNDLGMARGRHIKWCKNQRISIMNTGGWRKSSIICIFYCSITSSSGYNLNNKQLICPCSGTRHILSQRTSNPAHSFTIQASWWSLRTPCKEPEVRKFWPCTYSFKNMHL